MLRGADRGLVKQEPWMTESENAPIRII